MINQRLFNSHGIDTEKNLSISGFCHRPFDTLLVNKDGSCFLCECESWLPASAGNLQIQSIEQITQSHTARELQNSILDHSYRYCNNKHCSYLLDDRPNSGFPTKPIQPQIKYIRLAIDDSCNLSCPSCRVKPIFVKSGLEFHRRLSFAKKIIEYIRSQHHTICVHIGSDGDPFASLIYRYFIKNSSNLPNIRYTVQTNGLLLKKMFQKNNTLFKKLNILNVSIDGATKNTYETLRRGGTFDAIVDNLKFISTIKKNFNFSVRLHFVVQKKNYQEMPAMINLAEDVHADRLYFNKITDWGTYVNFSNEDIHNSNHKNYSDYQQVLDSVRTIIQSKPLGFVHMATIGHSNETI